VRRAERLVEAKQTDRVAAEVGGCLRGFREVGDVGCLFCWERTLPSFGPSLLVIDETTNFRSSLSLHSFSLKSTKYVLCVIEQMKMVVTCF
jgi:hypothetical protein